MSQLERVFEIHRILRTRGHFTLAEIAGLYEVKARTVRRDIEYLRDRLNAPIVWDASIRSYRYEKPYKELDFADERSLMLAALLRSLFESGRYLPALSSKLIDETDKHLSADFRRIVNRIIWNAPISEDCDMNVLAVILEGFILGKRLDLRYRNAKGEASERTVEAERLVNYSGRWYLAAWDLKRKGFRTFHLSRVLSLAIRNESVRADTEREAAVAAWLAAGYGIFKGGPIRDAVIRIRGQAADIVSRQIWHPNQRIDRPRDQSAYIDLILPVADWTELLGRTLSFGAAAEAIAPPDFRKAWKREIAALCQLAEKDDKEKSDEENTE